MAHVNKAIAAAVGAASIGAGAGGVPDTAADDLGARSPVFDAGASLRVRQELIRGAPQAVNGVLGRPGSERGKTKNQMRFRPSFWMELREREGRWRIYGRVTDEFRAGLVQKTRSQTFPGELVIDNLFIEAKEVAGIFDIRAGRQDLYRLYGLDHIFVDGTPGDGSCSTYANMVNIGFATGEDSRLDLFALYNADREELRWGTKRSRRLPKTGFGRGECEMDDWGAGAVWSSKLRDAELNVFWMRKETLSFHRDGAKHPRRRIHLFGAKFVPKPSDEISLPLEAMGQVGRDGDGNTLAAYAAYSGIGWKAKARPGEFRPFAGAGVLWLSGDKNATKEDGGRHAWDPMWYRGVDDGEMFLYGSLYGCGWWSNLVNAKLRAGVEIGPHHAAGIVTGPMFAAADDGVGGGGGLFRGFFTQARYDFPLWIADKENGGRFEMFGHLLAELFNPGDYYATDKPAWFLRWQVEMKF